MQMRKCFPHQHMSITDYGIYSVLMRLTRGGQFQLDSLRASTITRLFPRSKVTMETVEESLQRLTSDGWLKPVGYNKFQVLDHDKWAEAHSHEGCVAPIPQTAGQRG